MRALAVLAFALTAAPALADEPTLGGHIKGFAFQQLGEPHHLDRVGSRLQLAAWGDDGASFEYFAAIDFEIDSRLFTDDQPASRGQGFDIYPVEMYANLSRGPLELKIGQQFIFWGRMDLVTITDVITAWDYANMASEIEDYRLAPLAARLNWYIVDELMLDLVWVPLFRPNRIPTPETMGGLPVTKGDPNLPSRHPKDGEFGLRLSHSVSSWAFDWAISGYKGFEKNANVSVSPIVPDPPAPPVPTGMLWTNSYHPLWMMGGDFAKAIGPFVITGEAALKLTEDRDGLDPEVRNSRVDYAAGLTWTYSENLSINALYVAQVLLDYGRRQERAALTALMGNEPEFVARPWSHQGYVRVNARFFDDFGTQLMALYNVTYRDFFLLGFLFWDVADGLKLFLGVVGFGGENDSTPFGRQKDASRAFVELKYSF